MRVKVLITLMICLNCLNATAQDEQPSVELLEFLGAWETKEGKWIDPTQFVETPEIAQVEKEEKVND